MTDKELMDEARGWLTDCGSTRLGKPNLTSPKKNLVKQPPYTEREEAAMSDYEQRLRAAVREHNAAGGNINEDALIAAAGCAGGPEWGGIDWFEMSPLRTEDSDG